MQELKPQARNLLKNLLNKPLREDHFIKKRTKIVNDIILWCQQFEFEAGVSLPNEHYQFTRKNIDKIALTLVEHSFAPLETDFTNKTHVQAAKISANEKLGKRKPKDSLLLVALIQKNSIALLEQQFYQGSTDQTSNLTKQFNIEVEVQKIVLTGYQQLIVIENRDSFNDWSLYQHKIPLINTLVVYRGDGGDAKAYVKLSKRWKKEKPNAAMIYFGDFDLKGISIAISAHYDHLMLPSFDDLQTALKPEHYPCEQIKYLTSVSKTCPENWLKVVNLLINKQSGLRQQWMFDFILKLY